MLVFIYGILIVGKIVISTNNSPKAIGPYSQAINVKGSLTYTSGQIPINLKGEMISDIFEEQVVQVLKNIEGILIERNRKLNDIVKLTVFMIDLSNFEKLNKIFEIYFQDTCFPARSVVEVSKLPKDSQVEIEAIFYDE
jgi:2-iminobutanoate/2-iminopropanoate deaminase